MIRWCAYCQRFLSEAAPFDDYRISHTICPSCSRKLGDFHQAEEDGLAGIIYFYRRLEAVALGGSQATVEQIVEESRQLDIRPVDLMMGLLQPLLAKVGTLWAAGVVTVGVEHRFSSLVGDLLATLRVTAATGVGKAVAPELILVNADGNYHTLGVQMAELYLAIRGIPTLAVVPGLPTEEVVNLVATHKPKAVGFSVALTTQMKHVREVREVIRKLPDPPQRILIGGPALRMGLAPDPSFQFDVCRNLSEVPILLGGSSLLRVDPNGEEIDDA